MLGLGQGLGNVQQTMADYLAQKKAKDLQSLQLGMQLQGNDALNDPSIVAQLAKQGVPLQRGAAGAPNVSPTTGVILPQHMLDAQRESKLKNQEMDFTQSIYDAINPSLKPQPAPAAPQMTTPPGMPPGMPNFGDASPISRMMTTPQPIGTPPAPGAPAAPGAVPHAGLPSDFMKTGRTGNVFMDARIKNMFHLGEEPLEDISRFNPQTGQTEIHKVPRSDAAGMVSIKGPNEAQLKTLGEVEDMLNVADAASALYNPDWVGPGAARLYTAKQSMGAAGKMIFGGDDPKRAQLYQALNTLSEGRLRQLSGAAVTPTEFTRVLGQVPNQWDNPDQFQAKMKFFQPMMQMVRQRLQGLKTGKSLAEMIQATGEIADPAGSAAPSATGAPSAAPNAAPSAVAPPAGGGAAALTPTSGIKLSVTPTMAATWAKQNGISVQEAGKQLMARANQMNGQ